MDIICMTLILYILIASVCRFVCVHVCVFKCLSGNETISVGENKHDLCSHGAYSLNK